jgi:hypothetical protein
LGKAPSTTTTSATTSETTGSQIVGAITSTIIVRGSVARLISTWATFSGVRMNTAIMIASRASPNRLLTSHSSWPATPYPPTMAGTRAVITAQIPVVTTQRMPLKSLSSMLPRLLTAMSAPKPTNTPASSAIETKRSAFCMGLHS